MEHLPRDLLFELSSYLSAISYTRLALSCRDLYQQLHSNDFAIQSEIANEMAIYAALIKKENLFITGSAGVGKSYLIDRIVEHAQLMKLRSKLVSTTAISACNHYKASTFHSFFQIPAECTSVADYDFNNKIKMFINKLKKLKLLIIEEVSMLPAALLELGSTICKYYREDASPMGGVQLIVVGDFYQLPPIKGGYAFQSFLWQQLNFHVIILPISIRHQKDPRFYHLLQRIRVGKPSDDDCRLLRTRSVDWVGSSTEADLPDVDEVDHLNILEPLKLFAVNKGALELNQRRFDELLGTDFGTSIAEDRLVRKIKIEPDLTITGGRYTDTDRYLPINSGVPISKYKSSISNKFNKHLERIQFKQGAQYLVTTNLHTANGIVNGSMVILQSTTPGSVIVKTVKGRLVDIEKVAVRVKLDGSIYYERYQFPLILGYATTIHNSQGMSMDRVFIDLDRVFAEHQVYVALSRVRSLAGLSLKSFDPNKIKVSLVVERFYNALKNN